MNGYSLLLEIGRVFAFLLQLSLVVCKLILISGHGIDIILLRFIICTYLYRADSAASDNNNNTPERGGLTEFGKVIKILLFILLAFLYYVMHQKCMYVFCRIVLQVFLVIDSNSHFLQLCGLVGGVGNEPAWDDCRLGSRERAYNAGHIGSVPSPCDIQPFSSFSTLQPLKKRA